MWYQVVEGLKLSIKSKNTDSFWGEKVFFEESEWTKCVKHVGRFSWKWFCWVYLNECKEKPLKETELTQIWEENGGD